MKFKKALIIIAVASFVFQAFGQLSLRECVNAIKGVPKARWSTDTVSEKEKVGASLQMIAGDIVDGSLIPDSLPNFTIYHPTPIQIQIWCKRVLDGGGMIQRMIPSIVTSNTWAVSGDTISDQLIKTTCRRRVCAFAVFDIR